MRCSPPHAPASTSLSGFRYYGISVLRDYERRNFESAGPRVWRGRRVGVFLSSPEALAGRPARQASAASRPLFSWSSARRLLRVGV